MTFLYPSAIPYQSLSNILAFYIILLLSGKLKQVAIKNTLNDMMTVWG